jgi:TPR repeat protein
MRAWFVLLLGCAGGAVESAERPGPPVVITPTPTAVAPPPTCPADDEPDCERWCAEGDAESCARLAALVLGRDGVVPRVRELFERACAGGSGKGCNGLGVFAQRSDPPDTTAAREHYERACEMGYAGGCYNLGQMHRFGVGTGADLAAAAGWYERACDGGHGDGCAALGTLYWGESAILADADKAAALFEKACKLDVAAACHNFGLALLIRGDEGGAKELFRRACKLGSKPGCDHAHTLPRPSAP